MSEGVQPSGAGGAQIVQLPVTAEAPKKGRPDSPPPPPTQPAEGGAAAARGRGGLRLILIIIVPLLLALAGGYFWLRSGRYQGTDNAYVTQPILSLSADVAGRIVEIDAKENDSVEAGAVLFKIDPAPFQIALDQAQAALASARLNVEQLRVAYTTDQAKVAADQQALDIRQRQQDRNTNLAGKGFVAPDTSDQTLLLLQQAQASLQLDQQAEKGALAALNGDPNIKTDDHPSVKAAQAAVETAQLNLDRTTVAAPAAGVVSQITSFNVGQYVPAGTTIVSLVETDQSWIEANFKETQLGSMKTGQPATVTVDAYPGETLQGTVQSIGAATGAEFSLIPPQNATGNWVKVVQRLPVRIEVKPNPGMPLRSGMSANVTVDTGRTRLDQLLH